MGEYSGQEIRRLEGKWHAHWEKSGLYRVREDTSRPKYYVLDMFPYPSGAGLHVGHPLGYIASDIVARYKRLKGYNVLHPMGFDAFGLPAEQYAIQTGQHPALTTRKNIETYRRQMRSIGFSYDWDREVQTSDPRFYKWTQWIFMQLFNSWYNFAAKPAGKTEPIETLINEFDRSGNAGINAACDEGTPTFAASDWKTFTENEKEAMLERYRIAFRSETIVNWCRALGTVLSNDEVKDGVSERGGYPVERIRMWQWSMRISAYANRLLSGLEEIDWPEPLKEMQRNWIGKSVGAELSFSITGPNPASAKAGAGNIDVFTTRIDTIFGVTFLVLAPEHDLVEKITPADRRQDVAQYVSVATNRSERERMSEVKRVSGVFTGAFAKHPFTGKDIPVWVADYVLAGYGTGAVMGVPSNDTRDYAFAKHFDIEITPILEGPTSDITKENFEPKSGKMINSDFLNGLPWEKAIDRALDELERRHLGKRKVNYRIRDAIFGRQRYWGEPFPIYYQDGMPRLVREDDLPVTLPEIDEYKPTETGDPPLGRAKDWTYTPRPPAKGGPLELTTMPGWAGSSWYWFRYMDPHNEKAFCGKDIQAYWKDVDLYIGGSEHATGHLMYSRFWSKALHDLGFVDSEEPFKRLINQGHIQGISKFVYRINGTNRFVSYNLKDAYSVTPLHVDVRLVEGDHLDLEALKKWRDDLAGAEFILEDENRQAATEGKGLYVCGSEVEKMSKSRHNVVNPDDIIEKYGADTLRMYEMFLGPIELSKPWNTNGIDGVYRFLRKFWNLFHDEKGSWNIAETRPDNDELKVMHRTIKKVAEDIERYSFNTAVSEFMICTNELTTLACNKRAILEPLTVALAPFAPHITEELWQLLRNKGSVHEAGFPAYDERFLTVVSFEYPVSVNGKVRARMEFALDMPKEDIEKLVLASDAVLKWTQGKAPKKVIIVPGKIVNVVI